MSKKQQPKADYADKIAEHVFPCVNVNGTITIQVPYGQIGEVPIDQMQFPARPVYGERAEKELVNVRAKLARYIRRRIETTTVTPRKKARAAR